MEIQTRHRRSAEAKRPKGRAVIALAERREMPVAVLFAALVVGMAAWVKSAFGGDAPPAPADTRPIPSSAGEAVASLALVDSALTAFSSARHIADDPVSPTEPTGMEVADLGRIGRGPEAADLSRFFSMEEPVLDLPASPADGPASAGMPGWAPESGATLTDAAPGGDVPAPARSSGGGKGIDVKDNNGAGNGDAGGGGSAEPEFAAISFEALFAQLAEVARPFHPASVRDIGSAAIGDWISAQELQRLRGDDGRSGAEAAFMARENQTHQLLSTPDSREAFLDRHFPSERAGTAELGGAMLTEVPSGSLPEAVPVSDTMGGIL